MSTHVADWLRSEGIDSGASRIAVKIGRETYHGASYFESWKAQGLNGPILYLLGNVPPAYKRSRRICWRFPGEQQDWYLAGFADAAAAMTMPRFHPFGAWFQLRAWPRVFLPTGEMPDGSQAATIDAYEQTPYKRAQILDVTSCSHD